MIIKNNERPPNYDHLAKCFALQKGVIFTYGSTIFNPDNVPLDSTLIKHEETHAKQQGDRPEAWWNRYILDPKFRIAMEVPAYQNQYREGKKHIKDKNNLYKFAFSLAHALSGPVYGNIITTQEALEAIRSETKINFVVDF
jgi:hypothetical protein